MNLLRFNNFINERFDVKNSFNYYYWEDLVENVNKIAESLGEELIENAEIGCGSNGCAYELKSGKVMKLTTDKYEAFSVSRLRRLRNFKHIAGYYDVREISTKYNNSYVIIMDLIYPLNEEESEFWEDNYMDYFNFFSKFSDDEFLDIVYNHDDDYADINLERYNFWKSLIGERKQFLKDIKASGIHIPEIHKENVGFDKFGTIKAFDTMMLDKDISKTKFNKPILKYEP